MRLRFKELVHMVFTSKGGDVSWQKHGTENASEVEVVKSGGECGEGVPSASCRSWIVSLWGARRRSLEFSSLSRMERAVKKERTPATVRTVSKDARSMWAFWVIAGDQWRRRYPEMWCVWPCISTGKRREAIEGRGSSKCPYRNSPVSDSLCRCG